MYLCDNNESSHIKEEMSGHVHCACSEWLEEQEHVLSMCWACGLHGNYQGNLYFTKPYYLKYYLKE